jgi:hypothetical protein
MPETAGEPVAALLDAELERGRAFGVVVPLSNGLPAAVNREVLIEERRDREV